MPYDAIAAGTTEDTQGAGSGDALKLSYRTPQLRQLGSLTELTQGDSICSYYPEYCS